MSAPETTDPLVVNTTDGTVWTRREATRDGLALYAPEKCAGCPEFVMATYAELEGHGVAGTADVLPMPVGSEPQALSPERLAEIRNRRLDEVTPGPWLVADGENGKPVVYVELPAGGVRVLFGGATSEADVQFAASARRSVPELLADNDRLRARIAELEALTPARVQTCRVCGAGYTYGEPCSICEFRKRMAAELQARGLDGEHYASVHHDYRVGHDLPETGGV